MKKARLFSFLLALILISVAVAPVSADIGGTQKSSFAIQNVSGNTATVSVTFIAPDGTEYNPPILRPASGSTPALPNPFDLAAGTSVEIYVPSIPSDGLPSGSYSVMISSTERVVATVNVLGEGAINFNGTYYGEETGSQTFYMASLLYNYFGWYSSVTIQNVGDVSTDVTLTAKCTNGTTVVYKKTGLAKHAGVTFDVMKATPFTGAFTAGVKYDCSAAIASTAANIVAIDNQTVPTLGNTQSFNGVAAGSQKLYAPVLFVSYFTWDSSLSIVKVGTGNTAAVTVNYSDGATASTCNLTDAAPSCTLYMPTYHPLKAGQVRSLFAAQITSVGAPVVSVVNAGTKTSGQAQTYNAVASGSASVLAPGLFKQYYGWISSVTCQNVSSTAISTAISVEYSGYAGNKYDTKVLAQNEAVEIAVFNESFLPTKFVGAATFTAKAANASIACIINHNNSTQMATTKGDWSTSVNAISK